MVCAIWLGEHPLGKTFTTGDKEQFTVVGVVADARINDLKKTANMVYLAYWQNPWWRVYFFIHSSQPTSGLTDSIRREIWKIDPQVAIPVLKSLDDQVSDSVATERFQTMLLSSFGVAALLLALLGVYGVLAYSVSAAGAGVRDSHRAGLGESCSDAAGCASGGGSGGGRGCHRTGDGSGGDAVGREPALRDQSRRSFGCPGECCGSARRR